MEATLPCDHGWSGGGQITIDRQIRRLVLRVHSGRLRAAEAFKAGETPGGHLVCMTASGVGWLIQAMVGSLGGVGRRANRWGVAALAWGGTNRRGVWGSGGGPSWIDPNRWGKAGQYLSVLNWASE